MPENRRMALHWKIVIGLVLGLVTGVALNQWCQRNHSHSH